MKKLSIGALDKKMMRHMVFGWKTGVQKSELEKRIKRDMDAIQDIPQKKRKHVALSKLRLRKRGDPLLAREIQD
jgi:hypothetical protein